MHPQDPACIRVKFKTKNVSIAKFWMQLPSHCEQAFCKHAFFLGSSISVLAFLGASVTVQYEEEKRKIVAITHVRSSWNIVVCAHWESDAARARRSHTLSLSLTHTQTHTNTHTHTHTLTHTQYIHTHTHAHTHTHTHTHIYIYVYICPCM